MRSGNKSDRFKNVYRNLIELTKQNLLVKIPTFGKYYAWLFFRQSACHLSKTELNIVLINHCYDQDIEALKIAANQNCKVKLIVIGNTYLVNYVKSILPDSASTFEGYVDKRLKGEKNRMIKDFDKHLKGLLKRSKKIVFVAPSDQFFWIREFITACKNNEIPFIITDKEGTVSPHSFESHAHEIKKYAPFISDYALLWSDEHKRFYLHSGAPEEKLYALGQPRSDFWAHKEKWKKREEVLNLLHMRPTKINVLYFDFDEYYYLHDKYIKAGINWISFLKEIHDVIIEEANARPDINFIIKLHPQAPNAPAVIEKYRELGINNIYVLTGAALSNDLITISDLVIGFHSTVILEAMLTNLPIVYPFWGKALKISEDLIAFHDNKGIDIVRSKVALSNKIGFYLEQERPVLAGEDKMFERQKLTEKYFGHVDGNASKRIIDFIADLRIKQIS